MLLREVETGIHQMRVNGINASGMGNVAFGKVVKINTESAHFNMDKSGIDPKIASVIGIIEGNKDTANLDGDILSTLNKFVRDKIGDYSKKEGLVTEKICGDVYLFTGREAACARKITNKIGKNSVHRPWSQAQLVKDLRLSDIIGRAKHASAFDEICAEFNNKGALTSIIYKNIRNT